MNNYVGNLNVDKTKKPFFKRLGWKQSVTGYAFLAPTVIFFIVFTLLPLVMAFYYAFTDYNLIKVRNFVGFDNFIEAFKDTRFLKSFLNVFLYALMNVPLCIVTSLSAAILVNRKIRGVKVFRVLYYIPAVTSGVAIAYIWSWLYNYDYGLFNAILGKFGIGPLKWTGSDSYFALFCVVIVSVWSGLGGNMLIFLAALKGVPEDVYEAADIDGASGFKKVIYITIPSIAPTMYFILTMSIIGAFQTFDLIYMMIPGGLPLLFTETPVMKIYDKAFGSLLRAGYASAMSIILMVVIIIVTFVAQRFTKEDATA